MSVSKTTRSFTVLTLKDRISYPSDAMILLVVVAALMVVPCAAAVTLVMTAVLAETAA